MPVLKKLIKRLIGRRLSGSFRRSLERLRLLWLRIAVRSRFLSRIHYLLFSSAFDREANAVISGHLGYLHNCAGEEVTNYFLRRSIHRLEKGLIMRPRRAIFARDYISQTVAAFCAGIERNADPEELAWAKLVLEKYFEVTAEDPHIDQARAAFKSVVASPQQILLDSTEHYVPYRRVVPEQPVVSFEALTDLARYRRSVRWYQQIPVPRALIDKALYVAALSPSACNRQPLEFRIFDEPETVQRVASLAVGTRGFEHNFPAIAVLIGRQRAYPHPRDRHVIYIDGGLAAMSFMFALETMGLASCPINWPDLAEPEARISQSLGLSADERVVMLISIGYPDPDGMVPASRKVGLEHYRTYAETSA